MYKQLAIHLGTWSENPANFLQHVAGRRILHEGHKRMIFSQRTHADRELIFRKALFTIVAREIIAIGFNFIRTSITILDSVAVHDRMRQAGHVGVIYCVKASHIIALERVVLLKACCSSN